MLPPLSRGPGVPAASLSGVSNVAGVESINIEGITSCEPAAR